MIKAPNLNLDYEENFLSPEEADDLIQTLESTLEWKSLTRRTAISFGDPGFAYTISIRGKTTTRPVRPWDDLPQLIEIKKRVENRTQERVTYCVIQRYPEGKGILPHRDKEMSPGTTITGISLGATRTLRMAPCYHNRRAKEHIALDLPSGSLYSFCPPTNDYWSHSIDPGEGLRYSLTFRTYL